MASSAETIQELQLRPDWRQPTPGEHVCAVCRGAACFGYGNTWYCRTDVPAGFLPADRAPR